MKYYKRDQKRVRAHYCPERDACRGYVLAEGPEVSEVVWDTPYGPKSELIRNEDLQPEERG